jgi:hypothetical protein
VRSSHAELCRVVVAHDTQILRFVEAAHATLARLCLAHNVKQLIPSAHTSIEKIVERLWGQRRVVLKGAETDARSVDQKAQIKIAIARFKKMSALTTTAQDGTLRISQRS